MTQPRSTPFLRAFAAALVGAACAAPAQAAPAPAPLSEADALALGTEAYVYGYPLVTMELTRRVMTNVAAPTGSHAPMGRFAHMRAYPTPDDRDVTAPNADTLYSLAWLDVSKEPYVLSLPDTAGRFLLMPMLSGWTDVFQVPGTRTTGSAPRAFAVTGPGWKGTLPDGVTHYPSPTGLVWILGRTYCTGTPDDLKAAHALQERYEIVPLSAFGKPYTPPAGRVDPAVDMKTPVRDQVNRLDAAAYFRLLASLLKDNPPAEADAPMVAKLAALGIVPGRDFDPSTLPPAVARGLSGAPAAGWKAILGQEKSAGRLVNGWTYSLKTGLYGTDYLQRAFVTAIGLGANRPDDAVYPETRVDSSGRRLSGAHSYTIRFPKGQTPPVNAFWSLTMYDAALFFTPNPLHRHTLSPRDPLKYNPDGSLDLLISHAPPAADRQSNWLPAPEGNFVLMLRMYWPKPPVVDGTWSPPPVERLP